MPWLTVTGFTVLQYRQTQCISQAIHGNSLHFIHNGTQTVITQLLEFKKQ